MVGPNEGLALAAGITETGEPMNPRGTAGLHTLLLSALLIVGLALAVGCQSSPEAEEELPPAQPIEEFEEPDDTYQDPYDEPPADSEPAQPGAGQAPPTDPMAPQGQAETIDDEQLDDFADAFIQTQELGERVEAQMRQAQTQEEAQQIQQQALVELEQEVEATGMDFEEFLMIAERIERDPALQQRLETRLQERGAVPN